MPDKFDLVVIGAGPGGYEAAIAAAKLGLKTAIIEKDALGGTCLNRGCIPTKTLLHSAELYEGIREAARFGVDAQAPAVNAPAMAQHKKTTIATLQKGIAMQLKAVKVISYSGVGKVLSPGIVLLTQPDGQEVTLATEKILIATGSIPSVPPIPGHDLPGVMTSDGLLAYDGEPFASLLIIGGGVIGVEFAGIYQAFGTKVTILEALPSLIANMDKELGQSLKLSLKKKGVDIHTGARVMGLAQKENTLCCTYLEKDVEKTASAQAVLIATGRKPYTADVFAPDCTPVMERGRIVVDANYLTSIPGIYAIGDVSSPIQLAHAATAQGIKAVHLMAGKASDVAVDLIPGCIYTNPEIASVGLTLEEAKAQGLKAKSNKTLSSANGKSVLSLQERGFIKVVYLEDTHVIVGAQLFCARATDMVSEFALAIRKGLTLEAMADVVRPHPTFSEMITQSVGI